VGDLPFAPDAVRAVLGLGFLPLKARQAGSIPNLQSVHRQGRTPYPFHDRDILVTACGRICCSIYSRVSTDQGLEQDFNSLDAQYDAYQAYIRSRPARPSPCGPYRYRLGSESSLSLPR
jgi:hypothetical protein